MLDGVANGHVTYTNGTTFQSQAMYECDTGYQTSANASRTCQDGGIWDGIAATCDREHESIVLALLTPVGFNTICMLNSPSVSPFLSVQIM